MATGFYIYYRQSPTAEQLQQIEDIEDDKNPLEFKVALIFAALFVIFTLATYYTIEHFGAQGLNALSFLVGVTDITPFIANLFQSDFMVSASLIIAATLIASLSNNIMKLGYALVIGSKSNRKTLLVAFAVISFINLALVLIV